MAWTSQFIGKKLKVAKPDKSGFDQVAYKQLGTIHQAVFNPGGDKLVGFLVSRPDALGLIKREDLFVAADSVQLEGKFAASDDKRARFDNAAKKRMKLNWERCIEWVGMDVQTYAKERLGYIVDVEFNAATYKVVTFKLSEGVMSDAFVGTRTFDVSQFKGFTGTAMIVSDQVADAEFSGGAAAAAGKASVYVSQAGQKVVHDVASSVSATVKETKAAYLRSSQADPEIAEIPAQSVKVVKVDNSSETSDDKRSKIDTYAPIESRRSSDNKHSASRAVGRQLRATKDMFSSFVDEFKKNSK